MSNQTHAVKLGIRERRIHLYNSIELLFINMFAFVVPLCLYFQDWIPRIDSNWKITSWLPSARSIITSGEIPLWIPNTVHGINGAIFNQGLTGTDYLAILMLACGIQNTSLIFSLWLALNNLITFLALRWVFKFLGSSTMWCMGLISLLSLNFYAWNQIFFNFLGIQKFILILFFVFRLIERPNVRRLVQIAIFNLAILPFGGLIYTTPFLFYMELLVLFLFREDLHKTFRKNNKTANKEKLSFKFVTSFLTILYSIYITWQFVSLRVDIQVVSPGRSKTGDQTFNSFLNYGGYSGINKLGNLIGYGFQDVFLHLRHLDFFMTVSPLAISYIVLAILNINWKHPEARQARNWGWLWLLICLFTLPSKILTGTSFYLLPGIKILRHISYFSYLLIPVTILYCSSIYSFVEKGNSQSLAGRKKSRFRPYQSKLASRPKQHEFTTRYFRKGVKLSLGKVILQCIILSTIQLACIEIFLRKKKYITEDRIASFLIPLKELWKFGAINALGFLTVAMFLSYVIIQLVISKKKLTTMGNESRFGILFILGFIISGQIMTFAIQSKSMDENVMKNNVFFKQDLQLGKSLPKERITEEASFKLAALKNRKMQDPTNTMYDAIAIFVNEDYCQPVSRVDAISKSLSERWEAGLLNNSEPKNSRSLGCSLIDRKMVILNSEGEQVEAILNFKTLNYNKVEIVYDIHSNSITGNTGKPLYLIYFDANSKLNMWKAYDDNKLKYEFVSPKVNANMISIEGYKVIELTKSKGIITFEILPSLRLLVTAKATFDIIILLLLIGGLIRLTFIKERK